MLARAISQTFAIERNDARGGAYAGDGSRKVLLVPAERGADAPDKGLDTGRLQAAGHITLLIDEAICDSWLPNDLVRLTLASVSDGVP